MIARIIRFSIANRIFVLLAALVLAAWGTWAVKNTPVDALPDLLARADGLKKRHQELQQSKKR